MVRTRGCASRLHNTQFCESRFFPFSTLDQKEKYFSFQKLNRSDRNGLTSRFDENDKELLYSPFTVGSNVLRRVNTAQVR